MEVLFIKIAYQIFEGNGKDGLWEQGQNETWRAIMDEVSLL
jgi:hypothetical protein